MKRLVFLLTFSVMMTFSLTACRSIDAEPDKVGHMPAETITQISESTPVPISEAPVADAQWPNWIYDVNPDRPHWWTLPDGGISSLVDWHFHMMGIYFRAPEDFLPITEEIAMTYYLFFIASDGSYPHIFPMISAASAGDLDVQDRIIRAIANRIHIIQEAEADMYHSYVSLFSNRKLVYDEVTQEIFEKLQALLIETAPSNAGLFIRELPPNPTLTASAITKIFAQRAAQKAAVEPVEADLRSRFMAAIEAGVDPTSWSAEDMKMFRTNPTDFLEASYIAGVPFYGYWTADNRFESEIPLGTMEVYMIANYISHAKRDPVLYGHYRDFLAFVAEQHLSEGARWLLDFLHERIEINYNNF